MRASASPWAGSTRRWNRRRDRLRVVDRPSQHDWRCARRLAAKHSREATRPARSEVLTKTAPVRGDVAGIAHREREHVGRVAECLDDLERSRLLAVDAIRVHAVDERHGMALAELAHESQRDVEAGVDAHDRRTVHPRLEQFARRDASTRHDNNGTQAEPSRVRRGGCAGVAGGRADDRSAPFVQRRCDRDHHAPVLEGSRGVEAFELEMQ